MNRTMSGSSLFNLIAAVLYNAKSDRDFFISMSGLEGRFTLGEKGMAGHHLVDALPEEILEFVRSNI